MTRRASVIASLMSLGGGVGVRAQKPTGAKSWLVVNLGDDEGISRIEVYYKGRTLTLSAAEIMEALEGKSGQAETR